MEPYLKRNLINRGIERPSRRQFLEEFARVWPEFTATIGVQEPFAGTIRFKWLVRLAADEMAPFLEDPAGWIVARYGGGKVKMNLHHGMHFVSTKNFKPEGGPPWWGAPELSPQRGRVEGAQRCRGGEPDGCRSCSARRGR